MTIGQAIEVDDPATLRSRIRAAYRWLNLHRSELEKQYPDRYVAIHGDCVVGVSAELAPLQVELAEKRLEGAALITFVEPPGARMGI